MSKKASPSGSQALVPARSGGLDAQLDRAVPADSATAFLMVTQGEALGRIFPLLHNTMVIGRGADCDIQLSDPSVSSRHTRILNRPFGFDVEDLGSTNGTFVEGHPITRGTLTSGQTLRVGMVELKLLLDRRTLPTMVLIPSVVQDSAATRSPPRRHVDSDTSESGPSFQELLGKLIRVYRIARRHFLSAAIVFGLCLAAAAVSVVILPQGGIAQCEVKLHPEVISNPVDGTSKTTGLFESPERTFVGTGLIETTLKELGRVSPTTDETNAVAARLKLERVSDNGFVASFSESMFARGRYDLVNLLTTHIQNYVQSETDKALAVSVNEAEFLRTQTKAAESDLAAIDKELQRFKEENLSSLPESATLTLGSRAQMETRRTELTAQLARLSGEINGVKAQIASDGPLSQGRTQTSSVYRTRLASINEKLVALRAGGFTDEHPEVVALTEEKQLTQKMIDDELRAGTSELERSRDPALHGLESKLQNLRSLESAARAEAAELSGRIGLAKRLLTEMPRVDARLQDLLLKQEAQRKLYKELFEQLKKAEVRLQLERVSVSSRHELPSPPMLIKPRKSKTAIARFGIALVFAFVLVTIIILFRELRPMLQQAWNEAEADAGRTGGR